MDILKDKWVIINKLSKKQEEIIGLLVASAGIELHNTWNDDGCRTTYPYLLKGLNGLARMYNPSIAREYKQISYVQAIRQLKEAIKNREI